MNNPTSVDALLADQLVTRRVTTQVTTGFAMAALALASLGMYGVLTIMVAGRTREIGLRVVRGVVRDSVLTTAAGLARQA